MGDAEGTRRHADSIAALQSGAQALGVDLPAETLPRFQAYISTLLFWRTRVSLTAATTALGIVREHILDSLALVPLIKPAMRVADLGSGAGFPGIPLAIACPRAHFDLVESRRKKANFLREALRRTDVENARVREERAEDLRGQDYDAVVARAVWRLPQFLRVAAALLRDTGIAVAMKSARETATGVPHRSPFEPPESVPYRLPGGAQRVLLIYRKAGPVPRETLHTPPGLW